MRKLSAARLREAELRAPKPHEEMIILRTVVDPSPTGPVCAGVLSRTKTIPGGSIVEVFREPYPQPEELPAEMQVCARLRWIDHADGSELFVPPIPESELPSAPDPAAMARMVRYHNHTGEYAAGAPDLPI